MWGFLIVCIFIMIFSVIMCAKATDAQNNNSKSGSTQSTPRPLKTPESSHDYSPESIGSTSSQPQFIKCPVCNTVLSPQSRRCTDCGFCDLHPSFANSEDAKNWIDETVIPYRVKVEKLRKTSLDSSANELYARLAVLQHDNIIKHISETGGDFIVTDYRYGIEITQYTGDSSFVNIPKSINGRPVLKLANSLFANQACITDVFLPETLLIIGSEAFKKTSITSIKIPESVTFIGKEAFRETQLTEIIFPEQIQKIAENVCYKCEQLDTVIIMGATSIEEHAFSSCSNLRRLILSNCLQIIKDNAFSCCHELDEIILPESVQSVYAGLHGSSRGAIIVLNNQMEWRSHFYPDSFTREITIYCNPGSTSQQYARNKGIQAKNLSEYSGIRYS